MINIEGIKFNSLDYVMVVDKDLKVVYNTRLDKRVNASFIEADNKDYINKNLFEIYPTVKKDSSSSSVVKCITTGEIVVKRFQSYKDFNGNYYVTHNVTIPILRGGNIIGAVELVKDIKTIGNVNNFQEEIDEDAEIIDNLDNITFDDIVTNDSKMLNAIEQAKTMAISQKPNLIYGETGTGKEVFVQAMINYSQTSRDKVIIQNCAAIPENLIESILFGTYRGAYTGAENRKGLFEEADGGIIFLDELNSIPYDVQGKLLRVLQDGTFRSIGSNVQKKVKVKIIAAINEDPFEAINNKSLRKDLFYRLSSGMIFLPPLRERKGDIGLFTDKYIKEYNLLYNKEVEGITKNLEEIFYSYRWEGNVRELKHIIESMVSLSTNKVLDVNNLPAYMYDRIYKLESEEDNNKKKQFIKNIDDFDAETYNLKRIIDEKETEVIRDVLKITSGNKTKAAKLMGITRQTLRYKMNMLNLTE